MIKTLTGSPLPDLILGPLKVPSNGVKREIDAGAGLCVHSDICVALSRLGVMEGTADPWHAQPGLEIVLGRVAAACRCLCAAQERNSLSKRIVLLDMEIVHSSTASYPQHEVTGRVEHFGQRAQHAFI